MKTEHTVKIALVGLLLTSVPALYAQQGGHDHAEHSHDKHEHNDHHGHDHEAKIAGPNGGRIIHAVEPHFEFFVREDRKIQITFLNDENQPVAPAAQEVSAIAGDRRSPTRLTFAVQEGLLLSDTALPEGNNIPIILTVKNTPESNSVRERFMVNLTECPSCDYAEYACTCEHMEDDHDDHNH